MALAKSFSGSACPSCWKEGGGGSPIRGGASHPNRLGGSASHCASRSRPSFVKLGQILSTRPDLIPEDVIRELEKLQDQASSVSFEEIRNQVEGELGASLEELFNSFDLEPLASASISQIHRATIASEEVVVKVQRPAIRSRVERDIDLLHLIANAIERRIPEAKIYAPVGLVREFNRAMNAELDFGRESEHAERFARAFDGRSEIRFPRIYRSHFGRRVLTTEFLDGLKLHPALRAGFEGLKLSSVALRVIFEQVFRRTLSR